MFELPNHWYPTVGPRESSVTCLYGEKQAITIPALNLMIPLENVLISSHDKRIRPRTQATCAIQIYVRPRDIRGGEYELKTRFIIGEASPYIDGVEHEMKLEFDNGLLKDLEDIYPELHGAQSEFDIRGINMYHHFFKRKYKSEQQQVNEEIKKQWLAQYLRQFYIGADIKLSLYEKIFKMSAHIIFASPINRAQCHALYNQLELSRVPDFIE